MVVPPSSNPWLAAAIRLRDRATGRLRPVLNGSIRRLLILLVLIAILPALGIILLTGFEARNHALIESERNAQLLARGIGEIQERTTRGIHQLLEQLADLPQVKAGNIAVAADSFKSITAAFPMVENLVLTGPDGDVIAAAAPTERTSLIDLPSFRQAMRMRKVSSRIRPITRSSSSAMLRRGVSLWVMAICCNRDWMMTSSPTRSTSRSNREDSTRIVDAVTAGSAGPPVGSFAEEAARCANTVAV